ncbi:MAG: hypothetical protein V4659_13255 [Pseudomonadota bacterium]
MSNPAANPQRQQTMQRLKVGLTGLGLVLLLIGLASAVFNSVNRERPVAAIGGAQPATVEAITGDNATMPAKAASEPLAELGVAPPAADPGNQAAPAQ